MMKSETWDIVGPGTMPVLTFTSFLEASVSDEGKAVSVPVEKGGFTVYNKTDSPRTMDVTLGKEGEPSELQQIIETLKAYKIQAVTVSIITPITEYNDMTLESFSYQLRREDGRGLLIVELHFTEIRSVATKTSKITLENAKNPECASTVDRGRVPTSALYDTKLVPKITNFFGGGNASY